MATRPIPDVAKPEHQAAVLFQATTQFLGELAMRGFHATTDALDLAVNESSSKSSQIIGDTSKSYQERSELLHDEHKREIFFRDFGRAQHLAASVSLTYATLDTVLKEAVRLLKEHADVPAPTQNARGASIKANQAHLQKELPNFTALSPRDEQIFQQFTKIRNVLIHQGYFIEESDDTVRALLDSDDHGDYFELIPGFPILLRDHGVRSFVQICSKRIVAAGDGVYTRLLST